MWNTELYYMLLGMLVVVYAGGVNVTKPIQTEILSMKDFVLKLLRPHLTTAELVFSLLVLFLFCFVFLVVT